MILTGKSFPKNPESEIKPPGGTDVHVHTSCCKRTPSVPAPLPDILPQPQEGEYRLLPPHDADL